MSNNMKWDVNNLQVLSMMTDVWERSRSRLASVILADIRPFVKYDDGDLDKSAETASDFDKGKLVWNTPYAHYQWNLEAVKTLTKHPQASPRWTEKAENQCFEDWKRQGQKIYAEELEK